MNRPNPTLAQHLSLVVTVVLALTAALPAQPDWERVAVGASPPSRIEHVMAFDPFRGVTILFGGRGRGDTWEWDGSSWHERTPATSPRATLNHAMAYDVFRRGVVMFGGKADFGGLLDTTWEWDGVDWRQRVTSTQPSPREIHAMAFDPKRGRVVLFGGNDGVLRNDTWEWDGSQWTERQPATQPAGRWGHHLAFDVRTEKIMLFGGRGVSDVLDDTWLWDGTDWVELAPAHRPPPRTDHFLVCDTLRNRMVVFGGYGTATFIGDTWEWDGSDWVERLPATTPGSRCCHAAVYDAVRDEVVMFGGTGSGGTWTYQTDARAAFTNFGAGCSGTAGAPRVSANSLPWIGSVLTGSIDRVVRGTRVDLMIGVSNSVWGGTPLPLSLTPLGAPGCSLLVSVDEAVASFAVGGVADWSIPIPGSPALAGRSVYLQGVVLDPQVNALGVVTTDGAEVRIGIR